MPQGHHPNSRANLTPGGPGRPKGAKSKVPLTIKAAFETVYHQLHSEHPELFEDALRRGIESKKPTEAFAYLAIASHYVYGKPVETIKHQGDAQHPMTVVLELHGSSSSDQQSTSTGAVTSLVTVPFKALP